MLVDGNELEKDLIETDVCIVGTGPAGLSLASQIESTFNRVLLLELGSDEHSEPLQLEHRGETQILRHDSVSLHRDDDYLHRSRLFRIGGTSHHWSNWTRPLDSIDFEKRDWVADSGWPISRKDLEPYYRKAARICGVPEFQQKLHQEYKIEDFEDQIYHIATPPVRFGNLYDELIRKNDRILLLKNTRFNYFINRESSKTIPFAIARSQRGKKFQIKAKFFILSCGGIENARLLMNQNRHPEYGVKIQSRALGRYFLEHLHFYVGRSVLPHMSQQRYSVYDTQTPQNQVRVICPNPNLQRNSQLLNLQLNLDRINEESADTKAIQRLIGQLPGHFDGMLRVVMESAPNPSTGVELIDHRDSYECFKAKLILQISDLEIKSIRTLIKILGIKLGGNGLGRVQSWMEEKMDFDQEFFNRAFYLFGFHHIGTTRMATDSSKGVVDANQKVFGFENLFINGSSVFPTAGHSPPTLSLVALSLRLGTHLRKLRQ